MTDTAPAPYSPLRDVPNGYGLISRLNHWITAGVFLGALTLGLLLGYGELARETAAPMMQWHQALGLLVLLWGGWRILWRIAQGFPHPTTGTSKLEHMVARLVHIGLLAATLALPLSGLLMVLAGGHDLGVFGLTLVPASGEIEWLEELGEEVHEAAPIFVLGLLILHVGGALKHQFVDRDDTLRRMTRP